MRNKTNRKFITYDSIVMNEWVVKVSVIKDVMQICVVMIHRYDHTCTVRYFHNEEDLQVFFNGILEE